MGGILTFDFVFAALPEVSWPFAISGGNKHQVSKPKRFPEEREGCEGVGVGVGVGAKHIYRCTDSVPRDRSHGCCWALYMLPLFKFQTGISRSFLQCVCMFTTQPAAQTQSHQHALRMYTVLIFLLSPWAPSHVALGSLGTPPMQHLAHFVSFAPTQIPRMKRNERGIAYPVD